jgi:hypothetical protein
MNTNQILNKVRTLLGMEVKLEQMKLADGVTVLEADSFEPEMEVFIITEDEQKIPLPVGEYEMEDGRILVIEMEGVIKELKEAPMTEEVAPEEQATPEVPVEAEAQVTAPKKTVESVIKETFFSEIEALKKENEELKAKLETLSKVETSEVELSTEEEDPKPIIFNPENKVETVNFKIGAKGNQSTLNSIFSKIS